VGLKQTPRTKISDLHRAVNEFKKGYQPRTNLVKDENVYLLVESHSILSRWKNFFCQLFNVYGINDVRQTEMHTAKPLGSEPNSSEVISES
jgi:hypothetical protein